MVHKSTRKPPVKRVSERRMPHAIEQRRRTPYAIEQRRRQLEAWADELVSVAWEQLREQLDRQIPHLLDKPYGSRETFYSDAWCKAELQEAGEQLLLQAREWFDFQ